MFSPSHLLLVFVLLIALLQSASSQNDERPIYMDRREASPFGDILTEIKGKGLGGRMRFGKRAFRLPSQFRPRYEPVNNYY